MKRHYHKLNMDSQVKTIAAFANNNGAGWYPSSLLESIFMEKEDGDKRYTSACSYR